MMAIFKPRVDILLFLAMLPVSTYAQKAYETETYKTKLNGKEIILSLANGYINASVIRMFDRDKSKPLLFIPDSDSPGKGYTFRSQKGNTNSHFIFKNIQDVYDPLPDHIVGIYNNGKTSIPIKFRRVIRAN